MSSGDVGDQLRAILAALPEAQTNEALTCLEQAGQLIVQATEGSQASEPAQMVQQLGVAKEQVLEVLRLLQLVRAAVDRYVEQVRAHGSDTPVATVASAVAASSQPTSVHQPPAQSTKPELAQEPPPWDFSPEDVSAVMAELPPRVEKPNTEGRKTHGRWFDQDGHSDSIVSGKDEDAARAQETLRERGLKRVLSVTADVETKLAVRMRDNKVKRLTVIINNVPCKGTLGCDRLVPVLLPEGYELTVYGVDGFKKVYRGGAQPWW